MFLNKISLHNFRNFEFKTFNFTKGLNIIIGPNFTGKTNLIEAICYSCVASSLKNIDNEKSLINYKKNISTISAFFITEHNNLSVSFYIYKNKNKKILLLDNNNKPIKIEKKQWFSKILFVQCISVENELFFKNYYLNRDLNIILSLISEEYKNNLIKLRAGLKKYNFLKANNFKDNKYLNILKNNIYKINNIILSYRKDCIKKVNFYFKTLRKEFRFLENIEIGYTIRNKYNAERDRIIFYKNEKYSLKNFSTAMLKILLILYKVSLGFYIYKRTSKRPILFFDEILSGLDKENTFKIIEFLKNIKFQIFLTCNNEIFIKQRDIDKDIKIIYLKN